MAKLLASDRLVMFLVDSPYAHVAYIMGGGRPSVIASMERGHGTKSNPHASTVFKLIDAGVLAGAEFANLTLTDKGRKILAEERGRGWELVTETGSKPRMEQGGNAFKVGDRVWLKNLNGYPVMTGSTPLDRREIEFKVTSANGGRFQLDTYVSDGRRYCGGVGVTADSLMAAQD